MREGERGEERDAVREREGGERGCFNEEKMRNEAIDRSVGQKSHKR